MENQEQKNEQPKILDGKYDFRVSEKKWQDYWEENDIYAYEKESLKPTYSIDTPPPTVNGKIHMGHLSSYTHFECMARHHRMKGDNVYFPFGFADNILVRKNHRLSILRPTFNT